VDLGGAQTFNMVRGVHEPMVQEAMRRILRPGDVCWDVGANIGFHSLIAARLVGSRGQVYAVDPEPGNVAAVAVNARINGLANVTPIQAAATASSGPVKVVAVRDTLWTRLATVGDHPLSRQELTTRGVALDDLVRVDGLTPPDLVKMDVEGGELEVLAGMSGLLAERRPALIVEMHGKTAQVVELLRSAGYELINLDGPEPPESQPEIHLLAQPAPTGPGDG
jgi:FkbM family methyltransferase